MCGRLANGATKEEIEAWHEARRGAVLRHVNPEGHWLPSYNTGPTHVVAVLRHPAVLEPMTWGLHRAFRSKTGSTTRFLFNAQSEKYLADGRSRWKYGFERCVVLASSFFEWTGKGRAGQAHVIAVRDEPIVAFGALWKQDVVKRRKDDEGVEGPIVCILTCEPNELVQRFHHRAPVIIRPEDLDRWLDPELEREAVADLCAPYPAEEMTAWPVDNAVGTVGHNEPANLTPIAL